MVKNKKETLFDKYKYLVLVIGGSTLLLFVLVFAVGRPLWIDLGKSNQELKEKRNVLIKLEEKLENLKTLKGKESEIKEKNKVVLSALPTDKDISRLFVQFENIAAINGVDINTVTESGVLNTDSNTQSATSGTIRQVSYNLSGSSTSYSSIKQTLEALEKALRIINISKLDFGNSDGIISINIVATTYVRSE